MTIKILAFGIAKDIVGGTTADMSLADTSTVHELRRALEQRYPALKQLKSFMIAVNNEYVADEQTINETDEIAIIPPVSGG